MVDLGFRVDEGSKSLLYRKCSKYIVSRVLVNRLLGEIRISAFLI